MRLMNMPEKTSKRAKIVAVKQEEQSQSQGIILKAISRIMDNRGHKLLLNIQGNYPMSLGDNYH